MNKIEAQLLKIKKSGHIGLMTHVVVGYPSLAMTRDVILALARGGSDFIELQIPFSDPIADGPTIMKASDIALKQGITTADAMALMKEMSAQLDIPLLFMCYFNTIFRYGVEQFCKDTAAAGAAGLIVPDVPPEEESYDHLIQIAQKHGLVLIRVVSPASSPDRLARNAQSASGLVYCVSRFGVTGNETKLDTRLSEYLARVDEAFQLPKAVGFGISQPEQVRVLAKHAEIAVVGSAIVEKISTDAACIGEIEAFVRKLKSV